MNHRSDVAEDVVDLCRLVETRRASTDWAVEATAIRERLEGPLRIAIAGRVKAGKSTTLNALLGERLAPTDAGECTKIVTWYEHGPSYQVVAESAKGASESLAFQHADGRLHVDLGTRPVGEIDRLRVSWPSSSLRQITLIDTPGLGSIDDASSRRTRDFLDQSDGRPSDADAVIYLMRHAHGTDTEFLASFMDGEVLAASPVNSVALLSRADEIGAGRLDALESAARIAARYDQHELIASLTSCVLPFAGLLAETGLTLREEEASALRALAENDAAEIDWMLLSVDQFCDVDKTDLTVETRRGLLDRLGMYGLRFAIEEIRNQRAHSATELSRALVERSGLPALQRLVETDFLPRARTLHVSGALATLRRMAHRLRAADTDNPADTLADELERATEKIQSATIELAQLRAAHLVLGGVVVLPEPARGEVARVVQQDGQSTLLDLPEAAGPEERRSAAVHALGRWRTRAADPFASPLLIEVCEAMARTYEQLAATAAQTQPTTGGPR